MNKRLLLCVGVSLLGPAVFHAGASARSAQRGSVDSSRRVGAAMRAKGWALSSVAPGHWTGPAHVAKLRNGTTIKFDVDAKGSMTFQSSHTPNQGQALLKGFAKTATVSKPVKRWSFIIDELKNKQTGRVVRDMSRWGVVWRTETITKDATVSSVAPFRHGVVAVAPDVLKIKLAEHLAPKKEWRGGMWESPSSREPHYQVDVKRPLAAQELQVKLSGPVKFAQVRVGKQGGLFLDAVVKRANGRLAGEVYPINLGPGSWDGRTVSLGKRVGKPVRVDAKRFEIK